MARAPSPLRAKRVAPTPIGDQRSTEKMGNEAEKARRRLGLHGPTFGRDDLLDQVEALLATGVPSIALCGAPGVGKTRLTRELVARRRVADASPVFFSDWSAFISFEAACQALSTDLGATNIEGLADAIYMQDDCLIVIDNVEQFHSAIEAELSLWQSRAPAAQFVVSSTLHIASSGITTVHIPALASGDVKSPATALLNFHIERLGGQASQSSAALASLVGGVPLALGLVATRAASLGTSAVIKALGPGGRESRIDDVSRTMNVAWSFLSEPLRSFLAQLCCFHGAVSLEEVEAVVESPLHADEALIELIGSSLVEVDRQAEKRRYHLVITVSSFCKVRGESDYEAARKRHAAYYAERAYELAVRRNSRAPEDASALRELRHNIHRAFGTSREFEDFDNAMRCALALTQGRYVRLPTDAALLVLEHALGLGGGQESLRSRGLLVQARIDTRRGAFERGESAYRGLIDDLEGDAELQGKAYSGLAAILMAQWKVDGAEAAATTACSLHREAKDALGEAWTLLSMSAAASYRGEYERALDFVHRSIEIARALGEGGALVSFLMNAALLHLNRSDAGPARACLQEAHDIEQAFGDSLGHPWTNYALGIVELLDGAKRRGATLFARAVRASRATGESRLRASALCGLAELARFEGLFERAEVYIEEARTLVRSLTPVALRIRAVRASLLAEAGRAGEARSMMAQVRADIHPEWHERDLACLDLEEARVLLASARLEPGSEANTWEVRAAQLVARAEAVIERWPESVSTLSLRQFHGRGAKPKSAPRESPVLFWMHTESRTVEWNGNTIDCRRRPVLWRLFFALCESTSGVEPQDLIESVWEGQQMSPASARNRLYVAISGARKLTAPDLVELVDGKYRLSVDAGWA